MLKTHQDTLNKGFVHIVILLVLLLTSFVIISLVGINNSKTDQQTVQPETSTPIPTPIANYSTPSLKASEAYTIIFVGDSMIDAFGENFDYLRQNFSTYYPSTVFGLFNYGYGATNILTLPERLNSGTTYKGKTNEAILDRYLDIIIIGSFGHNPLSDMSLEEGLKRQTEILDQVVWELVTKKPETLIVFLAEFAPSEEFYAKGVVDLNPDQRSIWVTERKAYIKNHIDYANSHNIPLINIYEKSQINGDVNLEYISKDDYIHPSATGVAFMSQEIADFLYENAIIP